MILKFNNLIKKKKRHIKENKELWCNLTDDGIVSFVDVSISPRHHSEVDDFDEIIVEDTHQILYNETCTRWTQSFIVNREIDSL